MPILIGALTGFAIGLAGSCYDHVLVRRCPYTIFTCRTAQLAMIITTATGVWIGYSLS